MLYKNGGSDAALYGRMPLLQRKWTLVQTYTIPCTIEDHKLFKKIEIFASWRTHNQHRMTDGKKEAGKSQMGRGHFITSATIAVNSELEADMAVVAVSSQFQVLGDSRIALLLKQGTFPIWK